MSDYGNPPPPPPPPSYGAPEAAGAAGGPPPNYLVWAILTTVLCCPPLGIPSIVFSTRVNSKWAVGDVAGAREASSKAKTFAIWSTIAGIISGILLVVFTVVFIGAAVRTGNTFDNTAPGY